MHDTQDFRVAAAGRQVNWRVAASVACIDPLLASGVEGRVKSKREKTAENRVNTERARARSLHLKHPTATHPADIYEERCAHALVSGRRVVERRAAEAVHSVPPHVRVFHQCLGELKAKLK